MAAKPSFERIFRLTGVHLGAAGVGFFVAALLFAPKPREVTPLPARAARILELKRQLAAVSAAGTASAAPGRAAELCKALAWPACDVESLLRMGKEP